MAINQDIIDSSSQTSAIKSFYKDKVILITGSTGFLGKVILWKLLYHCSDFRRIYLLVRPKRGTTPAERTAKLLNSPPFTLKPLPENGMSIEDKVITVEADLMKAPDLGIDPQMRQQILDSVEVVLHVAASVNLAADLKTVTRLNAYGTMAVLEMASEMRRLVSFVYVSSITSFCHIPVIEEKLYPLATDESTKPQDLIDLILDNKISPERERELIENRPCPYTLSKAITEHLTVQYSKKFPIAITRPGGIMPSVSEPCPGWCDSYDGINGSALLQYVGVLRYFDYNYWVRSHFVPVDAVANATLMTAMYLAETSPSEPLIVNQESCQGLEGLSVGECMGLSRDMAKKWPSDHAIRSPMTVWKHRKANPWKLTYYQYVEHYLLGLIIDLVLRFGGRKPFAFKAMKRMHKMLNSIGPLINQDFSSTGNNLARIYKQLPAWDQKAFEVYVTKPLDMELYAIDVYFGHLKFLLKNPDPKYERNRVRVFWTETFITGMKLLVLVGLMWLLYLALVAPFSMIGAALAAAPIK